MFTVALVFVLVTVATQGAQVAHEPEPSVEEHIRDIVKELPIGSALRQQLLRGARGNGLHQPWMDDMRKEGVKRAVIQVGIRFDRHGRAKQMILKRIEFYTGYDGGIPVSDAAKLNEIRSSGLGQALTNLALQRAAHGAWIDVPRPRPEPFDGGANLEFYDDEWLPTATVPLYCAGKSCVSASEKQQ